MILIWTLHDNDSHSRALRRLKASAVWRIHAPDILSFRCMHALNAPIRSALNGSGGSPLGSRVSEQHRRGDILTEPRQENRPTLFDKNLANPMTCLDSGDEGFQNAKMAPRAEHQRRLSMSDAC